MSSTRRRPPPPPPAWTPEPWSDGETSALLEAWGPRHLRARGGPLRPADWRACAAAVTSHRGQGRPRTVYQCRNRVDYLKKRLRADRKRPKGAPPPRQVAGWLDRLRTLLRLAPSAPPGFAKGRGVAVAAPEVEEEEATGGSAHPLPCCWPPVPKRRRTAVSLLSPVTASSGVHPEGGGGSNCAEVVAALDRLAGTYERVEAAKQREAGWLEERRVETMRDLEIERMRLLVDVAVAVANSVDIDAAAAASTGDL